MIELLTALEQALTEEIAALRARDVEALDRAVESKRQTLAALGRNRTAGREGRTAGRDADPGSAEAVELLRRCRALNDIAGGAIATLRQDTVNTLSLLGVESGTADYGSPARPVRAGRALAVC